MITFERIKLLAKKRGKSLNQVEEDLNYGKNVLYRLKNSSPSAERLQELADYFGVSVDYLLGRTDEENIPNYDKGPGSDLKNYFRLTTANMSPSEVEEMEDELKKFNDFLIMKALEAKRNRQD